MEVLDKNSLIDCVNMELVITSNVHKAPKILVSISNTHIGQHEDIELGSTFRDHLEGEGIVGGEDVELGDYTYQVSLQRKSNSFCGGGIIGVQHIITAAHCVTDDIGGLPKNPIKVVAGVTNLKDEHAETRVEIDVDVVYIPRKYDPLTKKRTIGDIAVLKLLKPLNLDCNPNLSILQLGDLSETYAGETAIITGFGWNDVYLDINNKTKGLEKTGGKSYDKMRFTEANILSNELCLERVSNKMPIGEGHICAQVVQRKKSKLEGICADDSGVVSTSPVGCIKKLRPAVYTRVSEYLDFIQKAIDHVKDPQIRYRYIKIEGVNAL